MSDLETMPYGKDDSAPMFRSSAVDADPASQAGVAAGFVKALQTEAILVLGASKGADLVPIEYHGDFNWDWTQGNGDVNKPTYDYISGAMTPSTDASGTFAVGGSGSLAGIYAQLVNAIVWQFNTADQNALTTAQTNSAVQAEALVSTYTSIYGSITPAQMATAQKVAPGIATPSDYVLTYQAGYLWAGVPVGSPALSWHTMQAAPNLFNLLANAPPSADQVIESISAYLNAFGPAVTLIDEQFFGNNLLKNIQANLTPSAANGGVLQSNPTSTAYFPGFDSSMQPTDILSDLKNAAQAATVSFSASASSQSNYNVSFSGGGSFGWAGELLGISAGTSFQGDVAGQSSSGSSFDITMVYPGLTIVPFTPTVFGNTSAGATGWLDETVLYQALTNYNGGSKSTGFTFLSGLPAGITLGQNGVGYLSAVVLSAYPTITIDFSEGSMSSFQSWLATQTSFSVSLFGFIPIGGGSVDTYTAATSQNSTNSGFTLTLTPPLLSSSTAAPNQQVPVLAGQIAWLGAGPA
jgi:hypothetical protein